MTTIIPLPPAPEGPDSIPLQSPTSRRELLKTWAALSALGAVSLSPAAVLAAERAPKLPAELDFWTAVRDGNLERLRAMLTARPGLLQVEDNDGRSAFVVAFLAGQKAVMELLRERGYELDVVEACLVPDWERFDELAAADPASIRQAHPVGGTAMYAAARAGVGTSIWKVYRWGGEPDVRVGASFSPVRAALEVDDLSTAELTAASLLGNGADPNVPQPGGSSALHAAAARGSLDLVEMLIRKGARIDARDEAGATPRELALRGSSPRHRAAADMLARHGEIPRDASASRFSYDVNGKPYAAPRVDASDIKAEVTRFAFVGACHFRFDEVKASLERDPSLVHSVAATDEGAVEACAHTGQHKIVDFLLERGAPYSLTTAVMRGDTARVKTLLAEDPRRVYERGPHDFALLWYPVIGRGGVEMAQLLLDAGADIERQHHLGTTALHWAAMVGDREIAELLLAHGADLNRRGRKFAAERTTPLDLARERDREEMVRFLQERGARG